MCDALMEIVKPKVEAKVQAAKEETKRDLINKMLVKGMSVDQIADLLEESVETIEKLMKALQLQNKESATGILLNRVEKYAFTLRDI